MPKETAVMEDAAGAAPGRSEPVAEVLAPEEPDRSPSRLAPGIEAILLTSDKPVPALRLAESLGLVAPERSAPEGAAPAEEGAGAARKRPRKPEEAGESRAPEVIAGAVEVLNRIYAETGRSFRIESVAGGYRIMTLPDFAPVIAAFHRTRSSSRLSRAAVETLAIIAYRQPLTRAHLEAIRGVGCGEVLRSLMERKLITIKGRAEELGRPILYGTTREFLDAFGLASLKDLPSASELQTG